MTWAAIPFVFPWQHTSHVRTKHGLDRQDILLARGSVVSGVYPQMIYLERNLEAKYEEEKKGKTFNDIHTDLVSATHEFA